MPTKKKKKTPRNAYYYFMLEMKTEMKEKGIPMPQGMADVAKYAQPKWEKLSPTEQGHYKEMAREAKGKGTVDLEHKYDTTGRSFADINRELEFRKTTEEQMNRNIEAHCRNARVRNTLDTEKFYFVQFNYHCKTDEGRYVPCEMSLLEYTLQGGIMKHYHCFIDPGQLPVGYKYDCMKHSEDTHKIPIENFELADDQYFGQIIRIKNFFNQDKEQDVYPVYTMPEHMECAQKILNWLVCHSGVLVGECDLFQVYPLSKLLFELRNNAPELDDPKLPMQQKLPSAALAEMVLEKDVFMYTADIACPWHEEQDETRWCTLSVVKRYAFIISDYCCSCYNIPLKPKKHCPELSDINPCEVETYNYKPKRQPWNNHAQSTQPQQLGARSKHSQRAPPQEEMPGLIQHGRSFFNPKQEKDYIMGASPGVVTERPVYEAEDEIFQSSSDSDLEDSQPESLRQPKLRGAAAVVAMDEQKSPPALTDLDFPILGESVNPGTATAAGAWSFGRGFGRGKPVQQSLPKSVHSSVGTLSAGAGDRSTNTTVAWQLGQGQPVNAGTAASPGAWSLGRGFGHGKPVRESPTEGAESNVSILAGIGRGRGLMRDQFRDLSLNS